MTVERDLNTLEGIVIKREVPIPRTREGYEIKSFIYFDLNGVERSLFTRVVENWCLPSLIGFDFGGRLSYSDTYISAWKLLKDRGFNVVADVWKIGEDKVATTNLIEKGGSVYDRKIDAIIEREPLPMDSEFVKIPINLIQREADRLVNLANKSGVEHMTDDPFHIVVRPDKSWYILPLDIGKVRIHSRPKDLGKDVMQLNQYFTDRGLRDFARIQQNIKTLRDARGLA